MGVPVAVHAFDRGVIADFRELGPATLIDPKGATDQQLEQWLREEGLLA